MTKVYFYPKIVLKPNDIQNSYTKDFENALTEQHELLNKKANSKGVLDFFKYLNKADIFIFNWIEDIPRRRYGRLQVFFFLIFIAIKRVFRYKIVWVLHNKYSHNLAKNRWTDLMFSLLIKNSDLILTHSNEGVDFMKKNHPKYAYKVKYEIHPIKKKLINETSEKEYDFLFWGTIHPYKNILKFLEFLKTKKALEATKVMIVGHCFDKEYEKELKSFTSETITFENKFFEMDVIANLASRSKFILFTYSAKSVLSSGALMDSIRMNTKIIGPNHGAFKDLEFLPTVHVYNTYDDIIAIHKSGSTTKISNAQEKEIDRFFEENSWLEFAKKLHTHTQKLMS